MSFLDFCVYVQKKVLDSSYCCFECLLLPSSGLSDVPGESMVKLYCPKCCDVYNPKSSRHHHIDGVYFGTGFPHMLFMVRPELRPPKATNQFIPRLAETWEMVGGENPIMVFIFLCFPLGCMASRFMLSPTSYRFKPLPKVGQLRLHVLVHRSNRSNDRHCLPS